MNVEVDVHVANVTDLPALESVDWSNLDEESFRLKVSELDKETDFCEWLFLYLCSVPTAYRLVEIFVGTGLLFKMATALQCSVSMSCDDSTNQLRVEELLVAFLKKALDVCFENMNALGVCAIVALLDQSVCRSSVLQTVRSKIQLLCHAKNFKKHLPRARWPVVNDLLARVRVEPHAAVPPNPLLPALPETLSSSSSFVQLHDDCKTWTLERLLQVLKTNVETSDSASDVQSLSDHSELMSAVTNWNSIQVDIVLRDVDDLAQFLELYLHMNSDGYCALMLASTSNSIRLINNLLNRLRTMLERYFDNDLAASLIANELSRHHPINGRTCLMLAFENQSIDVVPILLSHGVKFDNTLVCKTRGWTTLLYAMNSQFGTSRTFFFSRLVAPIERSCGAAQVAQLLVDSPLVLCPLSYAAILGDVPLVDWMISYCISAGIATTPADLYNRVDVNHCTALAYACFNGHASLVQKMLKAGANPLHAVTLTTEVGAALSIQIVRTMRDFSHSGTSASQTNEPLRRCLSLLSASATSQGQSLADWRVKYFAPFLRADAPDLIDEQWTTLSNRLKEEPLYASRPMDEHSVERRRASIEWMARVWSEFGVSIASHVTIAKDLNLTDSFPVPASSAAASGSSSHSLPFPFFKETIRGEIVLPEVFVRAACMFDFATRLFDPSVVDDKLLCVALLVWSYLQFHSIDAQEVNMEGRILSAVCRVPCLSDQYRIHSTSLRRCIYTMVLHASHPLPITVPSPIEFISLLLQKERAFLIEKVEAALVPGAVLSGGEICPYRTDIDNLVLLLSQTSLGFCSYLLMLEPGAVLDGLQEIVSDPVRLAVASFSIAYSTVLHLDFDTFFPSISQVICLSEDSSFVLPCSPEHFTVSISKQHLDACVSGIIDMMQSFSSSHFHALTALFSSIFTGQSPPPTITTK